MIAEPSFQYYDLPINLLGLKANADYYSIELPMGFRHYFFLSHRTRLFVDGMAIWHLKSWQTKAGKREREMEMRSRPGFAFGAGLSRGRWSGEMRYAFKRDAFGSYVNIDVSHTKLSLIVGYRIFGK
ncbi:hypothetical protein [Dyadobacter sp. 676]|uniref:Outer membrane protein beta-barrel domain-containing protein n=1 Tax=Dyadobacter sp. 676 TaxID=3088362 RepID=A0AAU8FHN2_9BACT